MTSSRLFLLLMLCLVSEAFAAESSLDAVKEWRYAPAMCGDKAVTTETEIYVQFFAK